LFATSWYAAIAHFCSILERSFHFAFTDYCLQTKQGLQWKIEHIKKYLPIFIIVPGNCASFAKGAALRLSLNYLIALPLGNLASRWLRLWYQ
jgi:hypothetical protein